MKNKLIYCMVIVDLLLVGFYFNQTDEVDKINRIHQHKEDSNEIPIIEIDTDGKEIPGAHTWSYTENKQVILDKDIVDEEGTVTCDFLLLDEGDSVESKATVRYRGNSSRWFEKKSYSIHLVDENGMENAQELAGMATHNEWVLNGPFLDKTMIRNYLCMNISGEIMDYAPNVRFCELVLDGEYQGLYLLMESITRGDGRLDLTKPDAHSTVTSYVVHLERESDQTRGIHTFGYYSYKTGNSIFEVRYPGLETATAQRLNYIEEDISYIEKILYSYDFKSDYVNYEDYIDVNAFAQYFIINEFFGNLDAGNYSTYYYKNARGKLQPCVWDFNNACNNYADKVSGVDGFTMTHAVWYEQLIKDPEFVKTVVDTYKKLRTGVLSDEYLQDYIDDTVIWLDDEVEKNYSKWSHVWDPESQDWFTQEMNYLLPIERNPHSYEESVTQLKDYIRNRGAWLDENIDTLYQYCQDSRNANEELR